MKERVFDTKVQLLKYKALKAVIERAYAGTLTQAMYEIPKEIVPGPKSDMRCCIYKERAVLSERVRMAMGGDPENPNIIETLPVACDECPMESYFVTPACRGCINHKCMEVCPRGAISIVNRSAQIDAEKCIECGRCAKSCPYGAIIELARPCVKACKIGALKINEDKTAVIDNDKCVMCGACVYSCPFGAIVDKSYVLDCVEILKEAEKSKRKVYAIIAPAIVSQFKYAKIEQIVEGIKKLGFHQVIETAMGADITLGKELEELVERDKMTTSCCPSFVMYIERHFPKLKQYISSSPSPMVEVAKLIKRTSPGCKVVFIGPCASKKYECKLPKTDGAVDCVISFEELQAFLDARGIDVSTLEESPLNNASKYGRIFAKSGGITQGVKELKEKYGITKEICPIALNGLEQIRMAMLKMNAGKLPENFIEGMACEGGCLNGPLCLSHGDKNVLDVDKYGAQAREQDIAASMKLYELTKNDDKD
jgi:[FeFe] hydrogenase (group B1/B3)